MSPAYTTDPIPQLQQSQYSLRKQDVIGRIRARTERFESSFYPSCLPDWNDLCPEIRLAPTIAIFKRKLLSKIRPPAKSVFGIHDSIGLSHLTELRVGLSKLIFTSSNTILGIPSIQCALPTTVLRIRNTFCCFALPLRFNAEIFSHEFLRYCDHLDMLIYQTSP